MVTRDPKFVPHKFLSTSLFLVLPNRAGTPLQHKVTQKISRKTCKVEEGMEHFDLITEGAEGFLQF